MAWGDYIEQQTQQHGTAPNNSTNETFLMCTSLSLIVIVVIISYFLFRQWKKQTEKYTDEFKKLNNRKSWRLTNVIYWVLGLAYSFSAFLKDDDYFLSFTARLAMVCVFYFVLRELYYYVQFGRVKKKE